MGTLDYIVIALFAIAMIGIVVWVFKQKQKSSGDFFLAGRDATWLAIGASIFASNIGSEHLIGLAGAGASRWNGYGTLGNSGLDDPDSRLGVRAFLFQKYGAYDARIP